MPAYRRLREKYSFHELLSNSDLAAEATMSILDVCDPDGLIIFSDILTILAALGAEVSYEPELSVKAPPFDRLLQTFDPSPLLPTYEAIEKVSSEKGEIKALIGFCGGPFTLLSYLLEDVPRFKAFLLQQETFARKVLERIGSVVAAEMCIRDSSGKRELRCFRSSIQMQESSTLLFLCALPFRPLRKFWIA